MQTGRPCLDQCHRLLTRLSGVLSARCVPASVHAQAAHLRVLVLHIISKAWAGAMGQPSPLAALAMALLLELLRQLLRLPGIQAGGSALAKSMLFGLAALTFQLALENPYFRSGLPGGSAPRQARHAPVGWQAMCDVRPGHDYRVYLSAGRCLLGNLQHPPRKTS